MPKYKHQAGRGCRCRKCRDRRAYQRRRYAEKRAAAYGRQIVDNPPSPGRWRRLLNRFRPKPVDHLTECRACGRLVNKAVDNAADCDYPDCPTSDRR